MYNERLNLIRGSLLATMILAAIFYAIAAEVKSERMMTEEPAPVLAPATAAPTEPETEPTEAETAPETTAPTEPIKETSPTEEPATIATEPETEPETEPPYTADELEMLALVIYQEAGSDACSDDTRLMVGTVVMNRIADPRFPDTMYEVITAKLQYGELYWTGIVWPSRASHPTEAAAVERAYAIAERILLGERALPEDVIWQAEFIQGEIVEYSDGIYFCR